MAVFSGAPRAVKFGLSLLVSLCACAAQATGKVEAIAGSDTDIQSGASALTASASQGGFSANATRLQAFSTGSLSGGAFTAPRTPASARGGSDFTLFGVVSPAPLSLHFTFSGALSWNPENASVGIEQGVYIDAPGLINSVGWGISFVDGPVAMGDFAGLASNPFGVGAAGVGFENTLPAGSWNGQGSRQLVVTLLDVGSGLQGYLELSSSVALSGDASAIASVTLDAVTVPQSVVLEPGAHLRFDSGQQILITAVPEPDTWLMLCAGLLAMGWRARRAS